MSGMIKLFTKEDPPQTLIAERQTVIRRGGGGNIKNELVASSIDTIARHCAKLKGVSGDRGLDYLLQVRPNPFMTAYDWLYRTAAMLFSTGNAFSLITGHDGKITGIYPLTPTSSRLYQVQGRTIVEMTMIDGQPYTFYYDELVHLRKHFFGDTFFGNDNSPITPSVDVAETENAVLSSSLESSVSLRGILQYKQLLNAQDMQKIKDNFVQKYLSVDNASGIIPLDSKADFIPINNRPTLLDAEQSKLIRDKIYSYFNLHDKLVTSQQTEDEFSAFYESVVEPFAIALSQEMTAKIYTPKEIQRGNRIIFEASQLQYVSNKTKVDLIAQLMPLGVLTLNDALNILNLRTLGAEGDKRLQSLNFVDASKANDYQLSKESDNNERK